jgi:DNA (cytosine-5)-methyltransferase 1
MGYHQAGFTEIVGVDIAPQKRYPFTFVQADALTYLAQHGEKFDVIHASPPCQAYSKITPMPCRIRHPQLIEPVRNALHQTRKPYVIENVENARGYLREPFLMCGSMVGLPIWRHRYFETNAFPFPLMLACNHSAFPILITGTFRRKGWRRREYSGAEKRAAIGIDWMSIAELDEAIPPAYTRWIGTQLLAALTRGGR